MFEMMLHSCLYFLGQGSESYVELMSKEGIFAYVSIDWLQLIVCLGAYLFVWDMDGDGTKNI